MRDQEQRKTWMFVGQESAVLHHVCDQAVPAPGTEIPEVVLPRLSVAAVIGRISQEARSVEGPGQPVVTRGVLGESVRDLYNAFDGFGGLSPTVGDDLHVVSGRNERGW